jgi:hypothetical protein
MITLTMLLYHVYWDSVFLEAHSRLPSEKIPHLFGKPKIYYRVYNNLALRGT